MEVKRFICEAAEKQPEANKLLAEIHTLTGNTATEKALKSIINAEHMEKVWVKIGYADKKKDIGSISYLQVPPTWPDANMDSVKVVNLDNPPKAEYLKTVETPKETSTYLKLSNRLHFGQAQGTPFTMPPLSVKFDWAASSVTSELVLEGNYFISEIDFLQQKLLEHCKKEHNAAIISEAVTGKEWKEKIRVQKERTTTLPPGNHLGHYKALISCVHDDPETYE
eukprot:7750037-Ditylum_brightwellii.AAC.1